MLKMGVQKDPWREMILFFVDFLQKNQQKTKSSLSAYPSRGVKSPSLFNMVYLHPTT